MSDRRNHAQFAIDHKAKIYGMKMRDTIILICAGAFVTTLAAVLIMIFG